MYSRILKEAEALQEDLVIWRRQLHKIPEAGMSLPKTSEYVQQKLSEWDIPYEVTANGSCVTGKLGTEGPCILLRGDMDALPLREESGEEFASENGCMHACGHGSSPEVCIDPITAGVQVHLGLQELIARECPFGSEVSLTIGQFNAGDAPNIIPNTAVMKGTLRTFDNQLAEKLMCRITEISQKIAEAYRVKAEVKTLYQGPVLVCADEMNELVFSCVKELGLDGMVWDKLKGTGSEDFAYIAQKVPSTYFTIGASVGSPEEWISQHNPKVRFNEEILYKAAAIYTAVALKWLDYRSSSNSPRP